MNTWVCIIRRCTGKPNIIEEHSRRDRGEVRTIFTLRSPSDAKEAYFKHTLGIFDAPNLNPMDVWLRHKDAREYDSIDFDPLDGGTTPDVFNLFRGIAYGPDQCVRDDEQAKLVTDHILNIWCKGDQTVCDFLLDWMAHLVQRPGVKMVATPVLKGGQGAGKGIIVELLGRILGNEHFLAVTKLDSVTGQYQEEKIKTNRMHVRW
jgi:hypothetical protein